MDRAPDFESKAFLSMMPKGPKYVPYARILGVKTSYQNRSKIMDKLAKSAIAALILLIIAH